MPPPRSSPLTTLGWAAYLACSWTWCIGMFLPVLLIRDFGIWGFVVFAVPNILGAASVGWVLTADSAARIAAHHRPAVRCFSAITIAFQLFFLIAFFSTTTPWFATTLGISGLMWLIGVPLINGLTSGLISPTSRPRWSLLVWFSSVTCFVIFLTVHGPAGLPKPPQLAPTDLLYLLPVCILGFALSPYLDGTFLHVREHLSPTNARQAFGIGFGIFFLTMLLFTLSYAGLKPAATLAPLPLYALVVHITLQLGFTIGTHLRLLLPHLLPSPNQPPTKEQAARFGKRLGAIVVFTLFPFVFFLAATRQLSLSPHIRETIYRLFMSFYGLYFPAYVWLCMIPTSAPPTPATRRRALTIFTLASLLATPCYWLGFIDRQTIYLAPGLAIVLLARLLLKRSPTPSLA